MGTVTDNQSQLYSFYLQNQTKQTATSLADIKNDNTISTKDICSSLIYAVANFEEHLQNLDREFDKNKRMEESNVGASHQSRARRPKACVSNFLCAKCNIHFQSARAYASHNELHSMARQFPCDICERRYPLKCVMERHKRNVHSLTALENHFSCKFCGHKCHGMNEMEKHEILCTFNTPVEQSNCIAVVDTYQGMFLL